MDKETQDAFKLLTTKIQEGFDNIRQDMATKQDIKELRADIMRLEKTANKHYAILAQYGIAIKELQNC